MKLTWLGTASLLIEAGEWVPDPYGKKNPDRAALAFDPFLGIPFTDEQKKRTLFSTADAVFVTHGHFDHEHHVEQIYRGMPKPVYCTITPAVRLGRDGYPKEKINVISPGWEEQFGPLRVRAYQSRHCVFDQAFIRERAFSFRTYREIKKLAHLASLHRRCQENGETLMYELEGEGKRIQILGSLGLDEATAYTPGADVLIMAFQGRSDLEEAALPIVERLKPQRILLDHWDDSFPPFTENVETADFVQLMTEIYKIPTEALKLYEAIEL
ncbi:MAG: MBL fold metallo-hydrolase [Clostridia bacterium]|nr:MBL fold metallo-hydrolase [Clostridia bacterium]